MIVVSDTTPLRYLAVLGWLELLPRLFVRVHCPAAVMQECRHPHAPAALREWAEQPPAWLTVAQDVEVAKELLGKLDAGEASAITLAQPLQAEVILIDEQEGRRYAQARGEPFLILPQRGGGAKREEKMNHWMDSASLRQTEGLLHGEMTGNFCAA